jgi:hypothetical protein
MWDYAPVISPGDVTPGLGMRARHLPVDDAARNGNRGPLHEVLGELHDGAAHRRWNGLGVCLKLETCGAQDTVHIWGEIIPGHAGLPACAQQQRRSLADEGIRSGGEVGRFARGHGRLLSSEQVRPQQSYCVGVALPSRHGREARW